jgi:hypothetical protein
MSLAGHFPWQIKLSNIRQDTVTFKKTAENWAHRSEMGNSKKTHQFTLTVTYWGVSKDI